MPATVSFLVPLYNEATSVGPMLQSILQQKYGQDHLEVLIAMAPSDDGTEQEVENFIHNHPTFKVQVLPNPDRNTAVGRNLCLAHATGQFVFNFPDTQSQKQISCRYSSPRLRTYLPR